MIGSSKCRLAGAVVLLLVCSARGGVLVSDPNGMGGQWQDTVRFQTAMSVTTADVDYCVYAPGQFALSFPGWIDPNNSAYSTHYVYAYQIFNVSTAPYYGSVTRFSIGVGTYDQPDNNSFIDDPSYVNPSAMQLGVNTVGWDFNSPELTYGNVGDILYFSSPFGPATDTATVQGTYGLTDTDWLPSPAPEPATIALLAAGMALLARRRTRRT